MEWDAPILPIAGSHAGRSVVTIGWRAGSARANYRASITISAAVVKALGWDGVKAAVATPSLAGAHLRLVPARGDEPGWSATRPGKVRTCMSYLIPLSWVYSDKRQAAIVLHTIEGGALVLSLPEWARRKQPSEARAVQLAPTPKPSPVRGQNGGGRPPETLREPLSARDRTELECELRRGTAPAKAAELFGQPVAVVNAVRMTMGSRA